MRRWLRVTNFAESLPCETEQWTSALPLESLITRIYIGSNQSGFMWGYLFSGCKPSSSALPANICLELSFLSDAFKGNVLCLPTFCLELSLLGQPSNVFYSPTFA
ncbi:hypothetical protein RRG08_039037 [Elysia crispata]|uniref:Uncharacterized protein n=1 Tax=Elysia crispata TaxID=231223 RepID=A0AAE1AVR5_9GAST|nr:hypothetical protein RRG08_039037 [Elysia crispata]